MTVAEFSVDLNDLYNEPVGTMIITDAKLLTRPAVPGQYPKGYSHNTAHAYQLLSLGNDNGMYQWHIICQGNTSTAHQLLDRVFSAYVQACCLQLWCDARANYIVDGKTVQTNEYGFADGQYTMTFNVYCGTAYDQVDGFIATLTAGMTGKFVVVQPDVCEPGFNIRGFAVTG